METHEILRILLFKGSNGREMILLQSGYSDFMLRCKSKDLIELNIV